MKVVAVDISGETVLHRLLYTTRTYAADKLARSGEDVRLAARARMGQTPLGGVRDSHAMFAEDDDGAVRRPERQLTRLQIMAMDTMQLAHNATLIEIKARYKELVKRFHPDANGGDRGAEERLKQVIKAYGVLRASGLLS